MKPKYTALSFTVGILLFVAAFWNHDPQRNQFPPLYVRFAPIQSSILIVNAPNRLFAGSIFGVYIEFGYKPAPPSPISTPPPCGCGEG